MTNLQSGESRPNRAARWFLRLSLLLLVLHTLLFAYLWFNGVEASIRLNDLIGSGSIPSQTYSFAL